MSEDHPAREVRPWPLVDWRHILRASDPAAAATQQRLRTLRRREVLSDGIQDAVADNGRLIGKVSLFSELNLDAAVLSRKGLEQMSLHYREAAAGLERFSTQLLSEYQVRVAELAWSADRIRPTTLKLLCRLSDASVAARAQLPSVPDEDTIPGILIAQSDSRIRFTFTRSAGGFEIPKSMASRAGLSVGDPAVVAREILPNGIALLRLTPGLLLPNRSDAVEPHSTEPAPKPIVDEVRLPIESSLTYELLTDLS